MPTVSDSTDGWANLVLTDDMRRRARDGYIKLALGKLRAARELSHAIVEADPRDDQIELGLGLICSLPGFGP